MLVLDRSCLSDRPELAGQLKGLSQDLRILDPGHSRDWSHQSRRYCQGAIGWVADLSFRCSCDGENGRKMATDHHQVREWRNGREHCASEEILYGQGRRER